MKSPKRVEVTPPSSTVDRIEQVVVMCRKGDKYQLLRKIIAKENIELVLVFTRTKHGANKIVEYLEKYKIPSAAIHGNKSQSARESALANFKSGKIKVLVATDIAARGIDVQGVSHVINFDLPVEAESYVHRIGRTARAGKDGDAISFCDETERDALARIQKLIKLKLPVENFEAEPEEAFKPSRPHRDPRRPTARPPLCQQQLSPIPVPQLKKQTNPKKDQRELDIDSGIRNERLFKPYRIFRQKTPHLEKQSQQPP